MPGRPRSRLPPRPRCPGSPSRVPRPPRAESPDSDRCSGCGVGAEGPGRGGGEMRAGPGPRVLRGALSCGRRSVPASRDRGTAAAALRSPPRVPGVGWGLGYSWSDLGGRGAAGGWRCPRSPPLVLSSAGSLSVDPSLSHLPGMRSGRSGRRQECPGAARAGHARCGVARAAAGRGLAGPRLPSPYLATLGPRPGVGQRGRRGVTRPAPSRF